MIYLTDGMKIKVGNTTFQIVATPGHSAGCMSFIIPVTDNGEAHPLVIGTVKFDTVYLQKYRDMYQYVLDSGKI